MKHLRKLVMVLCLAFVMVGGFSTTTEAAGNMDLNSEVQSTNQIKLTWKKQKGVKGYKIYRDTYYSEGNCKHKLIATLGEKKTSFIDKKVKANQKYEYTIHAYYYKNGKEKNKSVGWTGWVSTKLTKPLFDEHESWAEGVYDLIKTTSNQITIPIGAIGPNGENGSVIGVDVYSRSSLKPDGIEVFKKVGKKYVSYKKIKIKKKAKEIYYFTDNNVIQGKKYNYKFRTYKKINGKTVYSPKTNAFTVCAMNNNPSIDFSIAEPFNSMEKTMTVSIVNNENYGNLTKIGQWYYLKDDTVNHYEIDFEAISYSYDNETWNTDMKTCKVKPGQTVYIKLFVQEDDFYEEKSNDTVSSESISFCFTQKFYRYYCEYDIVKNKMQKTIE